MFEKCFVLPQRESVVATLEGHNGNVTCAEFCPHYRSTLVSISEDRTYKVLCFMMAYYAVMLCSSILHVLNRQFRV